MQLLINIAVLTGAALLFLLFTVGIWTGVCLLLSRVGGWQELSRRYRATQPFTGERLRGQTGRMRSTARYRGCLTLGADSRGLFLAISPIFRPGHPPLFIPWNEISATREHRLLMDGVRLQLSQAPSVWLFIQLATAERILAQGPLRIEPRALP